MLLFPDPGILPSRAGPKVGGSIHLSLPGYPPHKDTRFSIRNPRHRHYERFVTLRREATKAMAGRKWFDGPVGLDLELFAPKLPVTLIDFVGGIMDTLDGSHGCEFTYLPIVYQDDCQVCLGQHCHITSPETRYELRLSFLPDESRQREGA